MQIQLETTKFLDSCSTVLQIQTELKTSPKDIVDTKRNSLPHELSASCLINYIPMCRRLLQYTHRSNVVAERNVLGRDHSCRDFFVLAGASCEFDIYSKRIDVSLLR